MIENHEHTQRFRLYCYMIPLKFGELTFEHIAYDAISGYLLYNRKATTPKEAIEEMFKTTYENLYSIQ